MNKGTGSTLLLVLSAVFSMSGMLTNARCAYAQRGGLTAWVVTRDGSSYEGVLGAGSIRAMIDGSAREISLREVLTIQSAGVSSSQESKRIETDLKTLTADSNPDARDTAIAELTDIGLPVLSPLLAAYKDTDVHEPAQLYRLFPRIMPSSADRIERHLDMIRLANGEILRGTLETNTLKLTESNGKVVTLKSDSIRRIAILRRNIDKSFEIQALRHCTPIGFLDTGTALTARSSVEETSQGFVRLSFDIDGWASDPNGIKVPGPHYNTNLVDGFPFGALVGRVGPKGQRWLAGRHIQKSGIGAGRLQLAVNDNGHWQNNIGGFRVKLHVTDAYDLGEPQ